MNKSGAITQRFKEISDGLFKGNQSEFARCVGIGESGIRSYLTGTLPKADALEKIANSLAISCEWLITGKGGMFPQEPTLNYDGVGVPYYNVDFTGGFDLVMNNQTQNPDGYINLPQYNKADTWANMTGHSMEPLLGHGDLIALKRIEDWNSYLLYGEIYGIITEEYRTVKRVRKSPTPDCIILEPINKDGYDEQEIPRRIIQQVWQVIGCAKRIF